MSTSSVEKHNDRGSRLVFHKDELDVVNMFHSERNWRTASPLRGEQLEPRLCLSAVAFARHEIVLASKTVLAADLDGDGDVDILSGPSLLRGIAWHENVDGKGSFGQPKEVTSEPANGLRASSQSLAVADVDGDGDVDVIATSSTDRTIAWHENLDGKGTFSAPNVIAVTAAQVVKAVDLDGDGDADILSAFGSELFWLANTNGSFSQPRTIASLLHGTESLDAADIDGDGDVDLLFSSYGIGGHFDWYENVDGLGNFGDRQTIADLDIGANSVHATDVDADGDIDVLGAFSVIGLGNVSWYENVDGQGDFSPREVTHFAFGPGAVSVSAADIDGDGDLDVFSSQSGSRANISWYENVDGKGNFGDPQVITAALNGFASMHIADLDGDGDSDVLSAYAWYENLSTPVAAGDANRDFQFDQQDIVQVLQSAKYLTGKPAAFEEGDWDGDGVFDQLDVVAALQTGNYLLGPYVAD